MGYGLMKAVYAPDDTAVRFGLELRFWRERQGYSMTKLADAADCDYSYISRIESGHRLPTRKWAIQLADALYLSGPQRARFLSLAGYTEYPFDNDIATALVSWLRLRGIHAD
jgi:transcriptional regulator with XRE-family HTH domain